MKFFKITTKQPVRKQYFFYILDRKFSLKVPEIQEGTVRCLPMQGDHFTPAYLSAFSSLLILFLTLFLFSLSF